MSTFTGLSVRFFLRFRRVRGLMKGSRLSSRGYQGALRPQSPHWFVCEVSTWVFEALCRRG